MPVERLETALYAEHLGYLFSFWDTEATHIPKGSLHLQNVRHLLSELEHPENALGAVIHIAGTNGKGSVSAFVERILLAHGLTTFRYTSPHLHTLRERFRQNGEVISPKTFCQSLEELRPVLESLEHSEGSPSVFEILTAMGLQLARGSDVAIFEAGVGGHYDATNVFGGSAAASRTTAVLTRVGLDHTNILGSTVQQIAQDKAQIFCPDRPAFSLESPDISEVLPLSELQVNSM